MGVKNWVGDMVYAFAGAGALDYFPCQYGTSRLSFRGPRRSTDGPFVACLGGTETYGRFVPRPYPDLLETALEMPVINLACANAGPDVYLGEEPVLRLVSQARVAVVQICGAQNLSNRYYAVHPRRNDRFLGATPQLRALFREVDFTAFSFTRHLLQVLQATSPDRFEVVAEELRSSWVLRMQGLLRALNCPVVLLWMAAAPPPPPIRRANLGRDPMLIDAEMVAALRPFASALVEALPSVEAQRAGGEGMAYGPMEAPAAACLPGPAHHREVAHQLGATLRGLM